MKVLIVKTSSMGDVIHTLPALTDAGKTLPSVSFDWVVEENFAEIPAWHPLVKKVIPVAVRRWRKNIFSQQTRSEWCEFKKQIAAEKYDLIIDAQGLIKSALLVRFAKGVRCGFAWDSAREPLASLFYQKKFSVLKNQHAISRVRELFSQIFSYALPDSVPDYGIDRRKVAVLENTARYLVFLHGTTWATKHWPEEYWLQLAKLAVQNGFVVKLPWGNAVEKERAERIAAACSGVEVLPRLNLQGVAKVLAAATGIVAVDTGLGHLAAALDVPTVSLYGPTNPALTGALGKSQVHLSAKFPCAPCFSKECLVEKRLIDPPCFETVSVERVWGELERICHPGSPLSS